MSFFFHPTLTQRPASFYPARLALPVFLPRGISNLLRSPPQQAAGSVVSSLSQDAHAWEPLVQPQAAELESHPLKGQVCLSSVLNHSL